VWDETDKAIIVKVVNTSDRQQPVSLNFAGMKKKEALTSGTCIKLSASDPDKDNTIEQPLAITPQESPVSISGSSFAITLEAHTFAVYKFVKTAAK
jgi:alpha-L-arabinofuranosidase